MQPDYELLHLSNQLIFIKWHKSPSNLQIEQRFLLDIQQILDEADHKIYFLSDLRKGRIITIRTLQSLGAMTVHENWGGSAAFSRNLTTKLFVNTFTRLSKTTEQKDRMFEKPEKALAFMASLHPGLIDGIDWGAHLGGDVVARA
jgi:hypothetical protein